MNRILLVILILCVLAGCKKSEDIPDIIKRQATIDDQIIRDYIAANNLGSVAKNVGQEQRFNKTDTIGVWYIVTNPGKGASTITNSTQITVGYTCKVLTTGQVVVQTNDFHPSFTLGNTIKGWQLGLAQSGIKKEGKVRLIMASRYAYGPFEQPQIGLPANSILDFEIELFDITN